MSLIFFSFNNSKNELGFIDGRYCPVCDKMEIHEGIRHHKHFVLCIPFYWSNKYFSVCIKCGHITSLIGQEKKYVKLLNKNAVKFFKTNSQLNTFLSDVINMCRENEVCSYGFIDNIKLNKTINQVINKYNVIHENRYDNRFYMDITRCCAESVLRVENEKKDVVSDDSLESIEAKLGKLKELYEKGLINENEYNERKAQFLESI